MTATQSTQHRCLAQHSQHIQQKTTWCLQQRYPTCPSWAPYAYGERIKRWNYFIKASKNFNSSYSSPYNEEPSSLTTGPSRRHSSLFLVSIYYPLFLATSGNISLWLSSSCRKARRQPENTLSSESEWLLYWIKRIERWDYLITNFMTLRWFWVGFFVLLFYMDLLPRFQTCSVGKR